VRAVLQQPQYQPIPVPEQIAVLLAVTEGLFDPLPVEDIRAAELAIREAVTRDLPGVCRRIEGGERLSNEDRAQLVKVAGDAVNALAQGEAILGDA
jgi:F-type H+/Na+-transporting ATPase subunit alpha